MTKVDFSRWSKVWVVVTLCSLLTYVLYWLPASFEIIYRSLLRGITLSRFFSFYFISDVLATAIGSLLRLTGVSIALGTFYLVWGPKKRTFLSVKKKVAIAIFLEGSYFLTYLPITLYYLNRGVVPMLFIGYLLQIILVFPLLAVLSVKIWRYNSLIANVPFWISLAAIGYLVNVWVGNVFRWLSMVEVSGFAFLFQGIVAIGFLNSLVTLSLSLIFAVVGCYYLSNRGDMKLGMKLFGISLILLGLHFVVFTLYSVFVGASLYSVMSTEVWLIAVLGLGVSMLFGAKKQTEDKEREN